MKKLRAFATAVTAMTLLACSLMAPLAVSAAPFDDSKDAVCSGISSAGNDTCAGTDSTITNIVRGILEILTYVVGVAAIVMIVLSGFKYITSSGDANKISAAKNTLIYALVGIAVVVLAQVMIRFVITAATPQTNPGATFSDDPCNHVSRDRQTPC